jgi:hypothetical protein
MRKVWGSTLAIVGVLAVFGPRAEAGPFLATQDNFVASAGPNTVQGTGGQASFLLVKNGGGGGFHRKAYLQFDLSTLPLGGPVFTSNASLTLNFIDTTSVVPNESLPAPGSSFNFTVYALANGNDGWSESTITWNNAPQNNTASGNGMLGGATAVGSFSVTGTGAGAHTINLAPGLTNFINGGGLGLDGLLSLVVVRDTAAGSTNYVHGFDSSEAAAQFAPVLNVAVNAPEPGTFALFATGLLPIAGAVYRRRRA